MRLFDIDPQQFGLLVSGRTRLPRRPAGSLRRSGSTASAASARCWRCTPDSSVATALCGFAPDYPLLLAARIVARHLRRRDAARWCSTIVADVVPYARARAAQRSSPSAFSLAAVMGVPLGLWFAAHYSWRAPFLVLAGVQRRWSAIVAWRAVAAARRARRRRSRGCRPLAQLRAIFGVPNHLRAFAFMIALMMSACSPSCRSSRAYNVANVGVARDRTCRSSISPADSTTLFTAQLIGRLADRYGKKRVFIDPRTCISHRADLIVMTHLPRLSLAVAVGVRRRSSSSCRGASDPRWRSSPAASQPRLRGSFMSFNASVQQLGSACRVVRRRTHHRPRGRRLR